MVRPPERDTTPNQELTMKTTLTIAAALSTALLLGAAAQAQGTIEKCYGVAKAGKNDCEKIAGGKLSS